MAASSWPSERVVPEEYSAPLHAFSIRFDEMDVALGTAPNLPQHGPGITDRRAVVVALPALGLHPNAGLPTGVQVAARYGIYSNDTFAKGGPGIPMQLQFQNVPAWLVTVYGPGYSRGTLGPRSITKHAFNVVVDASTGKVIVA